MSDLSKSCNYHIRELSKHTRLPESRDRIQTNRGRLITRSRKASAASARSEVSAAAWSTRISCLTGTLLKNGSDLTTELRRYRQLGKTEGKRNGPGGWSHVSANNSMCCFKKPAWWHVAKATGAIRLLDAASYTPNDAVSHTSNLLSENDLLSSARGRIAALYREMDHLSVQEWE